MRSKLFWAGVLVCLASAFSLAQDPDQGGTETLHAEL